MVYFEIVEVQTIEAQGTAENREGLINYEIVE